ncbi:MAG TPA: hypothetical protein PLC99_06245 [Verrucomicrobiota bacterium]|nr:hypothetical protein [Verrucomicrobiota bacterium]
MPTERKLADNWALHFSVDSFIAANGLSGMATLPQVLEIEYDGQTRFQNLDSR